MADRRRKPSSPAVECYTDADRDAANAFARDFATMVMGRAHDEISRLVERIAELEDEVGKWEQRYRRLVEKTCATPRRNG